MPTTMPIIETSFNWNFLSGLIGAFIGGFFTLIATSITLRHEIKKIRLQEMARIRWTKRWDVIAKAYSLLARTYIVLREMLHPQTEDESSRTINATWKTWKEFDNYYFQNCLFLSKDFDKRIREISDRFLRMTRELSSYSEDKYSNSPQSGHAHNFFQEFVNKHRDSLIGGDMEKKLEQLKDDLRDYLNQGEPT